MLKQENVSGDIALRFFDHDGQECNTTLKERMISISMEQFKKIDRKISLVSGVSKANAVLSALKGGLVDDHCASEREIPIISLSGNPFGVAVSIELLIRPALEKMMQDPSIGLKEVNGIMADNFEKGIKGRRFIRAYLENGKFHLPNGLHSNGVLSSMAGCNCLIDTKTMENQESRSLNAGDKVGAILL